MISATFNSQPVFLLDDPWNGRSAFKAEIEAIAQVESGLTNREHRTAQAATLRWRVRFDLTASGAATTRLVAALREYQTQPVLLPLWPAVREWGDVATSPITGALKYIWRPGTTKWLLTDDPAPTTFPDSSPITVHDLFAPVLWGRLEQRPGRWLSTDIYSLGIEFIENGPAAYAVTGVAAAASAAGPLSRPIWPGRINFDEVSSASTTRIIRDTAGFTRDEQETLYPQTNATEQTTPFIARDEAEVGTLLAAFHAHAGGASFWLPSYVADAALTADAGSSATSLTVATGHALKADDYLTIYDAGRDPLATWLARKLTATTATTLALASAFGVACTATGTLLTRLLLCRLAAPKLNLDWLAPGLATAKLATREVPPEYATPADETLGTTLGAQTGQQVWLYDFVLNLNGTDYHTRLTSFETDLSYASATWATHKISHGDITQGIALDRDEVSLRGLLFTAAGLTPLGKFATLRQEAPLKLTIRQGILSAGTVGSVAVLFVGEVSSARVKGAWVDARCVPFGGLLDRLVPTFRLQVGCNWALFSPGCGLLKTAWKHTAKIADPGTPGYPFSFDLNTLARTSGATTHYFDSWFAGGWIEFGTGANLQRRAILKSTTVTSNALTVWLQRDPEPFPAIGDDVVLYPGCDGRKETCRAWHTSNNPEGKFDNFHAFGGHPFIPAANPSLVKVSTAGSGGKKG